MKKTKTIKTPLMTAVAFGPTSCSSGLVLKSELSHSPEAQSGFVPKLSLHGGKNLALRAKKPFYNHNENDNQNLFGVQEFNGSRCHELFFSEAVFLLSLISKHEMRRMGLVMTDGSELPIRQHQQQTQILKKIEINERVFKVFVNN